MEDIEVVISGISGSYPSCDSYDEFKEALFTGRNLSEKNPRNWDCEEIENTRYGILKNSLKFDAFGFGVSGSLCSVMDPTTRRVMEQTFECFIDAGINPSELKHSNTCVIMVNSKGEWENFEISRQNQLDRHAMLGKARAMDANRISFFFDFTGPSYSIYGSESSGMLAIQNAVHLIKKGVCRQAVVGGSHIMIQPETFHAYRDQLHVISPDHDTRSFSDNANGYWRSEGAVVMLIQRKEDAYKSYATIDKVFSSIIPGPENITCEKMRNKMNNFLEEVYENENLDNIGLMVAEGYANPDIDADELNSIASAVASKRKEPLPVTSCKSVVGHSEACCSWFSIVSAIVALQTDSVVPVTNYKIGNRLVPALRDGSIKVFTEKAPLKGNRVAVNSFSNANMLFGHLILRRDDNFEPRSVTKDIPIPYIVGISGRNEQKMRDVLLKMKSEKESLANAVALAHKVFHQRIDRHTFRGYSILGTDHTSVIEKFDLPKPKPIWFIYSGMGSQWLEMGKRLMKFPLFAESIQKIHNVLKKEGVDFIRVLTQHDETILEDITNAFIGITGVQVALTDMLTSIGVTPDGIIGHSLGEVACAYADGCLTYEQAVLAALARGRASVEAKLERGMMAAVGLGYNQIKSRLPEGIEVACHNSSTSCTLSGKAEVMEKFVSQLKSQDIFARLVNVNNIAYHSKHIKPAAPFLLKSLEKVIPVPKKRSARWVSTSVTEDKWNTEEAQTSSARYHTNNLLNYVYFEEGCKHIPDDAICIEIAPHGLLQAIVKRSLSKCTHIPLTNKANSDPVNFLLNAFGMMFINGVQVNFDKLYPPVEFPVPCNTWSLQQLVTWDHGTTWTAEYFEYTDKQISYCHYVYLDPTTKKDSKLKMNYNICHQSLVPCTLLLGKVIKMFYKNNKIDSTSSILIQDLHFKYIKFHESEKTEFNMTLLNTGEFEVSIKYTEEGVLSGTIIELTDSSKYVPKKLPNFSCDNSIELNRQEVYSHFENFNINFNGSFKSLNSIIMSDKGFMSEMIISEDVEYQIEAMLSSTMFYSLYESSSPCMPSRIQSIAIDPKLLSKQTVGHILYNSTTGDLVTDGISINHVKLSPIDWKPDNIVSLKKNVFLPFHTYTSEDEMDFYDICSAFIVENTPKPSNDFVKAVESVVVKDNAKMPTTLNKFISSLVHCEVKALSVCEMLAECGRSECMSTVITYEGTSIPPRLNSVMSNGNTFLFLHVPGRQKPTLPKDVATIYSFSNANKSVLLLKKKRASVNVKNIVKTSTPNWEQKLPKSESSEPFFILMENMLISEITDTIKAFMNKVPNCVRFLSINQKSPAFDANSPVYQEIMKNDFKIAIGQGEIFGSLRNSELKELKAINDTSIQQTTENNKNDVEIKAVGMSFTEPTYPNKTSQVSALEYSGFKNGKSVMGVCKVNFGSLKKDDILQWDYPSSWTPQQAATVPLYYSMAYYAIIKYGVLTKEGTIFIHTGYSLLSQVFIRVALSIGCKVYTTYFTEEQRRFIISTFPKLPERNIIPCQKSKFGLEFMRRNNGEGANLVVNTLGQEYVEFCMEVLYSTDENRLGGRMVQISDEPMLADFNFGMEVFFKKSGVYGLVNHEILELDSDQKKWIQNSVAEGIKNGVVKPLDFVALDIYHTPDEIKNTALNTTASLPMKKVVISFTNSSNMTKTGGKNEKAVLLVGTHNLLCCDIISNYISKAYKHFHLFLNKEEISPILARRLKNLHKSNPSVTFEFHPTKIMDSAHECEILIQYIQKNAVLEHVYHLTSDRDSVYDNHLDTALRKFAKDVTLIAVGKPAQKLSEIRRKDGYNSIAFLHSQLSNKVIAHGIDKVINSQYGSLSTVVLENPSCKVMSDPKMVQNGLPDNVEELLSLRNCLSLKSSERVTLLTSKGIDYFQNNDATPIIMLPGLRCDRLFKFCHSIEYPVYMAKLPYFDETTRDLTHLAYQIAQDIMAKFPDLNIFTLLSEGWSSPLAILVTQILEEHGKLCAICMLNGSPTMIQQSLAKVTDLSILTKYFDLSLEMVEKLKKLPSWDDKVAQTLQVASTDCNKMVLKTSLDSLHLMLSLVKKFEMPHSPIKGKIILLTPTTQYSQKASDYLQTFSSLELLDLKVAGDDAMCEDSLKRLKVFPMHQNESIIKDKLNVDELTHPVYLIDIKKSMTLANDYEAAIIRTRRAYNVKAVTAIDA